jgi:hypothetical protein
MKKFFDILFLILRFFSTAKAWSLSSLNINASDTSVIHVSVYYGRAFLCLRHDSNPSLPTLVEASWPENIIGTKPKIFPSEQTHERRLGKCKGIKQATSTEIDVNGRLWMIDNGNEMCSAKIIVYDLLYFNDEIHFQAFGGLKGKKFSKIVIDPVQSENGDQRVYLSMIDEDYLLVYSFNERKLGKLKFT